MKGSGLIMLQDVQGSGSQGRSFGNAVWDTPREGRHRESNMVYTQQTSQVVPSSGTPGNFKTLRAKWSSVLDSGNYEPVLYLHE